MLNENKNGGKFKRDWYNTNSSYMHCFQFLDYLGVTTSTNTLSSALMQIRLQNIIGHDSMMILLFEAQHLLLMELIVTL
jgi:hypothetical protein